jgi:hypothetical protein
MKKERMLLKMAIEFEFTDDAEEEKVAELEIEEDSDEVEEIEFNMSDEEIDEWINELMILKEERKFVHLQIDDSLVLKVNYEDIDEE